MLRHRHVLRGKGPHAQASGQAQARPLPAARARALPCKLVCVCPRAHTDTNKQTKNTRARKHKHTWLLGLFEKPTPTLARVSTEVRVDKAFRMLENVHKTMVGNFDEFKETS